MRSISIALAMAAVSLAQTAPSVVTIKAGIDASGASGDVKPFALGTVLPGTCAMGSMFFKSDAPAGQNMYGCTAANTWTVQKGGTAFTQAGTGAVATTVDAVLKRTVSVLDFGADRTGAADSRASIQAAINAVASGGGTVRFPQGTYLLNSFVSTVHPWKFLNILVPSNVTLDADPGTILLQGSGGRQTVGAVPGALLVENTVLAVGLASTFQTIAFQDPARNGGFYAANATTPNDMTVTTTTAAQAGNFAAGDYIGVYSATSGDVILSEMSQVTSANPTTGVIGLAYPLARGFATVSVAKITSLAVSHVNLRNLTIQGAEPFSAQEGFDINIDHCRLIYDNTIGGSNVVAGFVVNTVRGFRVRDSSIEPVGNSLTGLELPQRNSQDVIFERTTFTAWSVVVGEYPAHWRFTDNHLWLTYNASGGPNGFAFQGWDMEARGNDIHAGDFGGAGSSCVTDFAGAPLSTSGNIRFAGNTIDCAATGQYAVLSQSSGTVWIGNHINCKSGTPGVHLYSDNFVFNGNYLSVANVPYAILPEALSTADSGVIGNNTVLGSASASYGIYLPNPASNQTGGYAVTGNNIRGFTINPIEPTHLPKHPGTRIAGNPGVTDQ